MGIEDAEESRLMAGAMPTDDPTWGEVSAFLVAVESAYPETPTAALETGHLAAVSRESRLLHAGHQTGRSTTMKDFFTLKTHRVLIGGLAAAIIALTAGVGVASAMGIDPLAQLLPAAPVETTPSPEPELTTPAVEATDDASDDPADDDEQDDATPKATAPSGHETEEADDADESGHEKAGDSGRTHQEADEADDESGDDEQGDDEQGDEHETTSTSGAHHGDDSGDQGDDQPEND